MKSLVSKWRPIPFILIVLLALFLRLWRLDYGQELPYLAHTDEPTQYNPAINMIKTGDLNPHFFNYPSLTIYIDAAVMYVGYWVGRLFGAFKSMANLQPIRTAQMAVGVVGTPQMLLLGRATTAVIGTLTIIPVYLLTRSLAERRWVPLASAAMLALSTAHIRFSHYMTVDAIATFFAVSSVAACTLALTKTRKWLLWLAAISGGLAASSKYNYAVLALPVALVTLVDPSLWVDDKIKRLWTSGLLFCLTFLLASPFVLLDYAEASRDIAHEMRHYATGHLGHTGNSFLWYLEYLWKENPFALLLGVPGLVAAAWRRRRAAIPFVVAAVTYYVLIGRQVVHFDRNALPVLVLLHVGAGVAMDTIVSWLPAGVREWRLALRALKVSPAFALLAVVPLLPSLWVLPSVLTPGPGGKAMAQAWFDRALETPYGERMLTKKYFPALNVAAEAYTVYLDPKECKVKYWSSVTESGYGLLEFQVFHFDIAVLGSGMFDRFYQNPDVYAKQVAIYDEFFEKVPDRLAFEGPTDPLLFAEGNGQVYVFFLTEQGRAFKAEMEQVLQQ